MQIARLSARTQLQSQMLGIVTDPLYSTLIGFAAVHEMRKHNLVGSVADDILYAGIIAINTARQPAMMGAIGSTLGLADATLPAAAAAAAGAAGAAVGAGGAKAAAGASKQAATTAAAGAGAGALVTMGKAAGGVALVAGGGLVTSKAVEALLPADAKAVWKKVPTWKKFMMASPLSFIPILDYAAKLKKARQG